MRGRYVQKRKKTDQKLMLVTVKIAQEVGLNNVKISSIIERANINRSTFYRHFQDKWDLIEQIEYRILNSIREYHNDFFKLYNAYNNDIRNQYLYKLLKFIDNRRRLIQIFLNDEGDTHFKIAFKAMIFDITKKTFEEMTNFSNKEIEILSNYLSYATIGTIKLWLDNDNKYSVEDVYHFLKKINPNTLKLF